MELALTEPKVDWREQAPPFLAGSAAVTAVISIAASQILLGLAIVALLANRERLRLPPIWIPVAAWMGWTVLSLIANGHLERGLPQIKKFYAYLILFAVYAAITRAKQIRWIALGWVLAASLSAAWSLEQFVQKYTAPRPPGVDFYTSYVGARITGFMSHWMTFSGQMMMALMIIGALLLFRRERRLIPFLAAAAVLVSAGLVLSFTRSMWPGAALGGLFLLWFRNKWLIATVPLLLGIALAANPFSVRDRMLSVVVPHNGNVDSNEHRAVLRRVGWEMIKAHPLVGVGPEQIRPQFMTYLPEDAPHPIPKEWYYDHLHNIYFHFAAERGVPALAALLWMIGQSLFDFARALRKAPRAESAWVLYAAIAVVLAVLVSGWGEVNLGDSEVLAMFLAMLGCGYSVLHTAPFADRVELASE
jgi:putative inorganic carbon (hco3(-)) transporter